MSEQGRLAGQTVVVIGGTSGIGLETARLARAEGADVILTARDPARLERVAAELGARSASAFDATDFDRLGRFFEQLPAPIDHVLVTGPGPYYAPWRSSTSTGRVETSRPICCCRSRWPAPPRARFDPEEASCSWAAPAAAVRWRDSR